MKTAISLSDKLFQDADALAAKLGISRSQLYATALTEYLDRFNADVVTDRLNTIHAATDLQIDLGIAGAQARPSSRQDAW